MPYPSEHSCRLIDPKKLGKFMGTDERKSDKYKKIYRILYMEDPKTGKSVEQAYRYPLKNGWKESEARGHCKDHKGTFEAAAPKKGNGEMDIKIKYMDTTARQDESSSVEEMEVNGQTFQFLRVPWRLTKLRVDRLNEVIKPDGIRFHDGLLKPDSTKGLVVLYTHAAGQSIFGGTNSLPIGKIDIDSFDITRDYVDADLLISLSDLFARQVANQIQMGILTTGSIGFKSIIESDEPLLEGQKGKSILEWELVEFSIVPIPANIDAVRKQYSIVQDMYHCLPDDQKCNFIENPDSEFAKEYISSLCNDGLQSVESHLIKERDKRNFQKRSKPLDYDDLLNEIDWNLRHMTDLQKKEGRVISTVNLKKLKNAHDEIGKVIEAADKTPIPKAETTEKEKKPKHQVVSMPKPEIKKKRYRVVTYDFESNKFLDLIK